MVIDKVRLNNFINKIKSFGEMTHYNKIQYFGYYLQKYEGFENFNTSDITECYKKSDEIKPNISVYLSNLRKSKAFIYENARYRLSRSCLMEVQDKVIHIPRLEKIYSAGDAWDIFKDIKNIIDSAKFEIFIIDPYTDKELFNEYLKEIKKNDIVIKILTSKHNSELDSIIKKFQMKYKKFKIKYNKKIHDRLIFVDEKCYILGQSINSIAVDKPGYLCEVDDWKKFKSVYQSIWTNVKNSAY